MKTITIQNFETRFPRFGIIDINDIDESIRENYLNIYSLYMDFINKYLLEKGNIQSYENDLVNNGFKRVNEANMDIYQDLATPTMNFFYIRNNIFPERLTNEEIEFLNRRILTGNYQFDNEAYNFVENTFRKLIFENVRNDKSPININYGPNSLQFFAPNNALVIGIRFSDTIENMNDALDVMNKKSYINQIREKFEKQMTELFGVEVRLIQYDSSSIKKILNTETTNLARH